LRELISCRATEGDERKFEACPDNEGQCDDISWLTAHEAACHPDRVVGGIGEVDINSLGLAACRGLHYEAILAAESTSKSLFTIGELRHRAPHAATED
jgi:hypothetical protein